MKKTFMGIELGSTRIKAVLISEANAVVAQGGHSWENRLENGIWTYPMEEVWAGLRGAVEQLLKSLKESVSIEGLGISGMMHGYMPFDAYGNLLTPFRTWRNTFTGKASQELTALFGRNMPQRWSITHLYHAVMNEEAHVPQIHHINTLAGYVHHRITGEFVVGIGEAIGMFPLDGKKYDAHCIRQFEKLVGEYCLPWKISDVLPGIRRAGEYAGVLTEEGARLLDPTGKLKAGTPLAPPEGDAGTGMVSTNSIAPLTGNVSAGTSIFSMTVLDKPLSRAYPEIDIVATPTGMPVAMVHCNNCTSDINAWVRTYHEFCGLVGADVSEDEVFRKFYLESLKGDPDCGGVVVVGYLSGEHVTDFETGCPLMLRSPAGSFTLPNFLRAQLYSALASLAIGMRILKREHVVIKQLTGHGGLFRTPKVGQQFLADAVNAPVTVMETAAEGGAYGMAVLAAYRVNRAEGETLESYLENKVFADARRTVLAPTEEGLKGFGTYLERFERALKVERAAIGAEIFN
ncbi:MAG: FGGY-family carbohydrate kinase [Bacillota bacterium]